ncbi:hypothetical protein EYC84_004567 [Monilinia fructicola]|uniref:Uncharacterized protein n=1 Tax=Monilinia fructicola TaxID=38448 RepID=A0A5M9K3A5_MONFR|nr:hypothetical protein EYC84_004567 [Monilinia fructicola]
MLFRAGCNGFKGGKGKEKQKSRKEANIEKHLMHGSISRSTCKLEDGPYESILGSSSQIDTVSRRGFVRGINKLE